MPILVFLKWGIKQVEGGKTAAYILTSFYMYLSIAYTDDISLEASNAKYHSNHE